MIKCSDCHSEKDEDEFYRHPETRTGRFAYCKPCATVRVQRRRKSDPEKAKAVRRDYYLANKARNYENGRVWRARNIERYRAYHATYERERRARLRATEG